MISCPRCGVVNPAGATACGACFSPITVSGAPSTGYGQPQGAAPSPYGQAQPGAPVSPYGFTQGAAAEPPYAAKRSAIPKVIGILMLVFGGLAVLSGLVGLVTGPSGGGFAGMGRHSGEFAEAFGRFKTLNSVSNLISLVIGGIELYAGGRALMYRANAPTWVMVYGWLNIGTTIIVIVMTYAWMMPLMKGIPGGAALVGFGVIVGGVVSIAWPIVAMALMSRPQAKAACSSDF